MKIRVWGCAVSMVLLIASAVSAQVTVKDEKTFFDAVVPADWTVARPTDDQEAKFLRYRATAPDMQRGVYFYVVEADYDVDLDKLENVDRQLGWDLGQLSSVLTLSDSVRERRYRAGAKGLYAAARFQVDGPNGYVVFAVSTSPNLAFADDVFRTFRVRTPIAKRMSRWFVKTRKMWGGLFLWFIAIIAIVTTSLVYRLIRKVFGARPSLDNTRLAFCRIMGITDLPERQQAILVDRFMSILQKRASARLLAALNPDDRKTFNTLVAEGRKNDDKARAFLLERGVDQDTLLVDETRKLCEDVKQSRVKLNRIEEIRNTVGDIELTSAVGLVLETVDAMSDD